MKVNIKKGFVIVGNAIRIAVFSVLILVLAVNVYTAFLRRTKPQALPWIFGYTQLIVNSGSMENAIHVDDLVIIQQNDDYTVNDIITFRQNNLFVTHRIMEVTETELITKGDANNIADEAINRSQVEGKVIKIIPKAGFLIRILQSPYSIALLLLAGVLLFYLGIGRRPECRGRESDQEGGQ